MTQCADLLLIKELSSITAEAIAQQRRLLAEAGEDTKLAEYISQQVILLKKIADGLQTLGTSSRHL